MAQPELTRFRSEDLDTIAEALAKTTGLRLPSGSRGALRDAALDRSRDVAGGDVSAYVDMLEDSADIGELAELYDRVAVCQTELFRGGTFFSVLETRVLPELRAHVANRPIRMWSAGCATGEETWSLAATAAQTFGSSAEVGIWATDWSRSALRLAESAVYPLAALEKIPEHLRPWFQIGEESFRPCPRLERMVHFSRHNLVEPGRIPTTGSMDLVLLCNVMIYFDPPVVAGVVGHMTRTLRPGAMLFLGRAESLWGVAHSLEIVDFDTVFGYRRPQTVATEDMRTLSRVVPSISPLRAPSSPATRPAEVGRPKERPSRAAEIVAFAEGMLIKGVLDEAEGAARELVANDPLCPDGHFLLGNVAERRGDDRAALDAYGRVIYLDRSFALAHFCRGGILERSGDARRARGAFEAAAAALDTAGVERFETLLESLSSESLKRLFGNKLAQRSR